MENLGIDPKLLIAQVVNFILFFIVFKAFIAKPFTGAIHKEKQKEHEKEKMLREIEEKHQRMVDEEAKWKADLQVERENILTETRKAADQIKTEMLQQAQKEASDLVQKTKKQIDAEREQLYKEVRDRVIDLSMSIVQKGLKDYLTEDIKRNVTRYIIDNLSKDVQKYEKQS